MTDLYRRSMASAVHCLRLISWTGYTGSRRTRLTAPWTCFSVAYATKIRFLPFYVPRQYRMDIDVRKGMFKLIGCSLVQWYMYMYVCWRTTKDLRSLLSRRCTKYVILVARTVCDCISRLFYRHLTVDLRMPTNIHMYT